jgi:hypothetical protein
MNRNPNDSGPGCSSWPDRAHARAEALAAHRRTEARDNFALAEALVAAMRCKRLAWQDMQAAPAGRASEIARDAYRLACSNLDAAERAAGVRP